MSEAQTHSCSTPTPTAMFSSAPWELSAITDQDLFFFLVFSWGLPGILRLCSLLHLLLVPWGCSGWEVPTSPESICIFAQTRLDIFYLLLTALAFKTRSTGIIAWEQRFCAVFSSCPEFSDVWWWSKSLWEKIISPTYPGDVFIDQEIRALPSSSKIYLGIGITRRPE